MKYWKVVLSFHCLCLSVFLYVGYRTTMVNFYEGLVIIKLILGMTLKNTAPGTELPCNCAGIGLLQLTILINHESCVSVCLLAFSEATRSPSIMEFWLKMLFGIFLRILGAFFMLFKMGFFVFFFESLEYEISTKRLF